MGMSTPGTCQSGHAVLPGELFCPYCGEYLRVDDRPDPDTDETMAETNPFGTAAYGSAPPGPDSYPAYPLAPYGYPAAPYGYPAGPHDYYPTGPHGYYPPGPYGYAPYPPPYGYHDPRYRALRAPSGAAPSRRPVAAGPVASMPQPPYGAPWLSSPYGYHPWGYYPYGYPHYPRPVAPPSNGMAIASMILGIVWFWWIGSVAAVILGHLALSQIKRTGEPGRGAAIAGIVLGWIGIAVLVLGLAIGATTN